MYRPKMRDPRTVAMYLRRRTFVFQALVNLKYRNGFSHPDVARIFKHLWDMNGNQMLQDGFNHDDATAAIMNALDHNDIEMVNLFLNAGYRVKKGSSAKSILSRRLSPEVIRKLLSPFGKRQPDDDILDNVFGSTNVKDQQRAKRIIDNLISANRNDLITSFLERSHRLTMPEAQYLHSKGIDIRPLWNRTVDPHLMRFLLRLYPDIRDSLIAHTGQSKLQQVLNQYTARLALPLLEAGVPLLGKDIARLLQPLWDDELVLRVLGHLMDRYGSDPMWSFNIASRIQEEQKKRYGPEKEEPVVRESVLRNDHWAEEDEENRQRAARVARELLSDSENDSDDDSEDGSDDDSEAMDTD